ncbi:hypothetical protein J437_LFUL016005 [Ladona fulva]|uniref:DUF5641 domain-containing protein n=1 Tax=Ladona fulva TaxID=123851 RepID=A0A8K0KKF5_LADFU|nr:hypothetical protein J437_LFUL016005 [Ladona fulva]
MRILQTSRRGLDPAVLQESAIWWRGPKWLSSPLENWPKQPDTLPAPQILIVQKAVEENFILKRFSSLTRLIRVLAYCLRFVACCRRSQDTETIFLSTSELAAARCNAIQLAQSFALAEEFSTVLVQIEACLNSRPLYSLSSDQDDLNALMPAHFLIGDTLFLIPEPEYISPTKNRLSRWQLLQRIQLNFRKRWSQEYLHHLQQRSRWRNPKENFAVGQLVVVRDERYPPSKWPLGPLPRSTQDLMDMFAWSPSRWQTLN